MVASNKNLGVSLSSARDGEPDERARVVPRHGNKKASAAYCGFSLMTLHRLINNPAEEFPTPSNVLSLESFSFDEIDEWFRKRKKRPTASNA